ncbi:MAG: biopolymer transporter ExbD [Spirochaetaceae bacterium]|jgi:biopolymer transport protein ExbD|nr:biopolymer transporter ExbD [Spirochaetaceae bacterium]
MNLRRPKRAGAGENAAFSDLAFLLIIYFLVIAGFTVNRGFPLDLSSRDPVSPVPQDEVLRFRLDREGRLFLDGLERNRREAESIIAASVASRPGLVLVLDVDPLAPWQEVVSFVELARRLEVQSFSFAGGRASP